MRRLLQRASLSRQSSIAGQIFLAMQDTSSCPLDELVLSLPCFTWAEVFMEVDRLRRTGHVQVTALGVGNYAVSLQNKGNLSREETGTLRV
jgi:hypothetical protein